MKEKFKDLLEFQQAQKELEAELTAKFNDFLLRIPLPISAVEVYTETTRVESATANIKVCVRVTV